MFIRIINQCICSVRFPQLPKVFNWLQQQIQIFGNSEGRKQFRNNLFVQSAVVNANLLSLSVLQNMF